MPKNKKHFFMQQPFANGLSLTGFTILELLVVVVIVGILAAIAIPTYNNKVERTYGERAVVNLELITSAWKANKIRTGTGYFSSNNSSSYSSYSSVNNTEAINQNLGINISDSNFNYNIHKYSTSHYFFFACRNSGTYQNSVLTFLYYSTTGREGWYNMSSPPSRWTWQPLSPAY